MSRRLSRPQSTPRVLVAPSILGIAAITGLVAGLAGDGAWDVAAWLMLGALPLTFAIAWVRRDR